jgi:hypothetical protein
MRLQRILSGRLGGFCRAVEALDLQLRVLDVLGENDRERRF